MKVLQHIDTVLEAKSYYRDAGSLEEIIDRWQNEDAKLYDDVMPLMIPLRDLWPYREYQWTREDARRSPEEWDQLVDKLDREGWKTSEPLIFIVGRKGGAKIGEGNHRIAIAKQLGMRKVPVRVLFYEGPVRKEPMPSRTAAPEPKPETRRPKAPERERTPEERERLDKLFDLMFKK